VSTPRTVVSSLFVALVSASALSACDGSALRYRPVRDSLAARRVAGDDAPYVWVLGSVGLPGRYRLVGAATLTLVLRDAGGIGAGAYHNVIVSRREAGRWVRRAYAVDAIEAGEAEDVVIYAGDVIDVVERTD
jgi:hypothetical protein